MSSPANGAAQEGGGGGGKKEAEEVARVPFLKLFSFADQWDCVLMTVGSLGACAHGASVPVFFIFFGKLINIIGIAYLFPTTVSGRVAKVINCSSRRRSHAHLRPFWRSQSQLTPPWRACALASWQQRRGLIFFCSVSRAQYSLDFVYLGIVILFSSWTGA